MNQETKICQNCQKEFTVEPEDFEFYEKIKVPAPTFCPECRMTRRMVFKNEKSFYKRKCDFCNKNIIAVFPQNVSFPVYCPFCWWSDKWNSMDYGRNYDFSKPFFEQFYELLKQVPRINLFTDYLRAINSEYTNYTGPLKNCYLLIQAENNENCFYSSSLFYSKDCSDCSMVTKTNNAYNLFNCEKCFNIFFSTNCASCFDVYFSKNLINCSNCFGCVNLRHKNYYIFNKAYSKENYIDFIKKLNLGSYKKIIELQKETWNFWLNYPNKFIQGLHNNNISGNYITNSHNVFYSYEIEGGECLKYCFQTHMPFNRDCYDYNDWGNNASLCYESINCGENISNVKFSLGSWIGNNWEYCDTIVSSDYVFGCVKLKHAKYCILNKQYTKEEYKELVPKIIEHMNSMPYIDKKGRVYKYGEFFPPELSPFCYNETIAQEYFPLTKEQAIEKGYQWKDPEVRNFQIDIKTQDLPDNIKDVNSDIVGKIIECANAKSQNSALSNCTTAFKIIDSELEFYKKMNLPLPRLCPNCRHYQRIQQRNPLKLWKRKCQCDGTHSSNGIYKNTIEHFHGNNPCPNEFETTYAPDRPEIVYCEKCYQSEVA